MSFLVVDKNTFFGGGGIMILDNLIIEGEKMKKIVKVFLVLVVMLISIMPIDNLSKIGMTKVNASDTEFTVGPISYEIEVMGTAFEHANEKVAVVSGCDKNVTSLKIPELVSHNGNKYKVCKIYGQCLISNKLTSITLPDTMEDVTDDSFALCSNLLTINVSPNNPYLSSKDGALYNKDQTVLIFVPTNVKSFRVPDSVTLILIYAFDGCKNLSNVTIPNGKANFPSTFNEFSNLIVYLRPNSETEEQAKQCKISYKYIKDITSIKLNKTSLFLDKGSSTTLKATINPTNTTDSKELIWTSSNPNVATVNSQGKVTAKANGTTIITAKTVNGKTASCKVTVKTPVFKLKATVKNATYTGKAIKQKITLKDGKKDLKNGKDYTLSYKNNKNTGKATITIKGKGSYSGTKTINFYIVPKKVTISSVKPGKKQLTVKYKKVTGASGYQIAYSTSKSKGFKYITVSYKTASKVIKKLKSKKNYYVKVRAYKTVGKKKYYGTYSKLKSVKVK